MRGQTNQHVLDARLQRRLRNEPTEAERRLWRHLRGKQLQGCKFRRQHPYESYILDFVCVEKRLVIEVDGSQHMGSQRDAERDAFLSQAGFQVLRFWNNGVLARTVDVVDAIVVALSASASEQNHPHPGPSLEGEGEVKCPAMKSLNV